VAAITLAGLKKPVKESFDKVNGDLKEVYSVLNRYSKALDRVGGSHILSMYSSTC
jgi:hypothetical protein